jgi:hypothetical protein
VFTTVALALPLLGAQPCTQRGERGGRPELSGPTVVTESGDFALHWTLEGDDAISAADGDADSVPDTVERVLDGLEVGRARFVLDGWRLPDLDTGDGGSTAIDVYLRPIGANGYAHPVPGPGEISSCWMEVDPGVESLGVGVIESVAAHELHHCVQYAYAPDGPSYLHEMTSTYQQYLLYPTPVMQAALEILWRTRLRQPERPFGDTGSRFEYAGFVFPWFWDLFESGGTPVARGPAMWEAIGARAGSDVGLDDAAAAIWGIPFEELYVRHQIWNDFACARDDGRHYPRDVLPCLLGGSEAPMVELPAGATSFDVDLPEARYAAASFAMPLGDERGVRLDCQRPAEEAAAARIALVVRDGAAREIASVLPEPGEPAALDGPLEGNGSALFVAASVGAGALTLSCRIDRLDLPPDSEPPPEGCGCQGGGAAGLLLLVPLRARRRSCPASASC